MADRIPVYQEEIDTIVGHLKGGGKFFSARIVQDMFDEMRRLQKCAGLAVLSSTVPTPRTTGISVPMKSTNGIEREAGLESDTIGALDGMGRSSGGDPSDR